MRENASEETGVPAVLADKMALLPTLLARDDCELHHPPILRLARAGVGGG